MGQELSQLTNNASAIDFMASSPGQSVLNSALSANSTASMTASTIALQAAQAHAQANLNSMMAASQMQQHLSMMNPHMTQEEIMHHSQQMAQVQAHQQQMAAAAQLQGQTVGAQGHPLISPVFINPATSQGNLISPHHIAEQANNNETTENHPNHHEVHHHNNNNNAANQPKTSSPNDPTKKMSDDNSDSAQEKSESNLIASPNNNNQPNGSLQKQNLSGKKVEDSGLANISNVSSNQTVNSNHNILSPVEHLAVNNNNSNNQLINNQNQNIQGPIIIPHQNFTTNNPSNQEDFSNSWNLYQNNSTVATQNSQISTVHQNNNYISPYPMAVAAQPTDQQNMAIYGSNYPQTNDFYAMGAAQNGAVMADQGKETEQHKN